MIYTVYEDDTGNLYRISSGISGGAYWMTFRTPLRGRRGHRVKSKYLPLRETREDAQRDLDEYANRKKFRRVGTVGMSDE